MEKKCHYVIFLGSLSLKEYLSQHMKIKPLTKVANVCSNVVINIQYSQMSSRDLMIMFLFYPSNYRWEFSTPLEIGCTTHLYWNWVKFVRKYVSQRRKYTFTCARNINCVLEAELWHFLERLHKLQKSCVNIHTVFHTTLFKIPNRLFFVQKHIFL